MYEDLLEEVKQEALMLALTAFDDPSEDHIDCIYQRLLVNYAHGQGTDGAVTVH